MSTKQHLFFYAKEHGWKDQQAQAASLTGSFLGECPECHLSRDQNTMGPAVYRGRHRPYHQEIAL